MKTIALFFGGLGNEAEVSAMSAKNVIRHFDYRRYRLKLVYWKKADQAFYELHNVNDQPRKRIRIEDFSRFFDLAFLMTHGRYGEDGVLQSILESQKIKYCGCGVLSSALCMDKAVLKKLFSSEPALKQVRYAVLDFALQPKAACEAEKARTVKEFQFPVFVKPSNSGSSVGITKVEKSSDLEKAIRTARRHDEKIIIEEGLVNPKEVEVAVMGNRELLVSRPGELRLVKDFYDYDDKYTKGEAQSVIPARLSAKQEKAVRELAAKAYRLAGCRGFARVDLFISGRNIFINEINTLPGFTDISMFPLLMMNEGMSYRELLNRIIKLALS